ncbi:hypothetical protein Cni_G29263 [Canna indica]|uniref:Trichome birefringence-like N-terminal domain-containing protein n=1 Tax=Canna indica TaxID=4628 RepID=A0AAQ3QTD8_9LILI|nr:hypothetical protein Cni_G29263 [Canna indica]
MESLLSPVLNRKLLLCAIASFLGFLLLSCSLQRASRPSTAIASLTHLESTSAMADLAGVSVPAPAPQPATAATIYSPPPQSAMEVEMVAASPSELVLAMNSSPGSSQAVHPSPPADGGEETTVEEKKCDIFEGKWVFDRWRYPLYQPHWCPFLSDQVSCRRNGRPDSEYEHWRWQPSGCDLPRYNGREMLEKWRGKRVVIVGDSLNRNMWESLACMLYSSVRKERAVVKQRSSDYKLFRALDYDCSVEFFWSPFLVELKEREDHAKILKLDKIFANGRRWLGADVMIFNTGHWWMHHGKMRAWNYFQRGDQVTEDMEAAVAFNRALRTWARWVDRNVNPRKTIVFFRSISPEHKTENLHFCYNQTKPITNERYVQWFPKSMVDIVERTIRKMTIPVTYLNITRLSEYRRDAHTAIYTSRQGKLLTIEQRLDPTRHADCSHWCLPGLPDTWNVLLFASIMTSSSSIISSTN